MTMTDEWKLQLTINGKRFFSLNSDGMCFFDSNDPVMVVARIALSQATYFFSDYEPLTEQELEDSATLLSDLLSGEQVVHLQIE
jgi:hypothetical protein